ncbi:YdbC family protein [Clostridium neuense]|uniref:YdbC family protein n=1 Tax=Clostridium neuense TaxID=1728934 RepID=A0ABW8TDY1_9CLOT
MSEIKFDIIKNIGILSEGNKGWRRELNIISWNGRKAKLDIRDWDETHIKMGKGITFSKLELKQLKDILNEIDIDELDIE